MLTGGQGGGWEPLLGAAVLDDANVVYSAHLYDPYAFTMQGAEWMPELEPIQNLPYPSNPQVVELEAARLRAAGRPDLAGAVAAYGDDFWGPGALAEIARGLADWSREKKRRVLINELGAYYKAPRFDCTQYLHDLRTALEDQGLGWNLWEYASGFGIFLVEHSVGGRESVDPWMLWALGLPDGEEPTLTYYVSAAGSDDYPGTSAGLPWRTLERASEAVYGPGESLLLARAETVQGSLRLHPGNAYGTFASPVTIGAYGTRVLLRHNQAYGQRMHASCHSDGGGYDFNGTHSVLEYNVSADNAGIDILLDDQTPVNHDVTVRYNISRRHGWQTQEGLLYVGGGRPEVGPALHHYFIYNNVFHATGAAGGPVVYIPNGAYTESPHIYLANNLFLSDGGVPMVQLDRSDMADNVLFQNNAYWDPTGQLRVEWGNDLTFASLAAWQSLGQETLQGEAVGFFADPSLCDDGEEVWSWYRPSTGSYLIDSGFDLSWLPEGTGNRDISGTSIPQGGGYEVGAQEVSAGCGPNHIVGTVPKRSFLTTVATTPPSMPPTLKATCATTAGARLPELSRSLAATTPRRKVEPMTMPTVHRSTPRSSKLR